jgi:hypothetical protein
VVSRRGRQGTTRSSKQAQIPEGEVLVAGQQKLYKAGQKKSGSQGGGTVSSGSQQGATSKSQTGKTHAVKNRSVNHGRRNGR